MSAAFELKALERRHDLRLPEALGPLFGVPSSLSRPHGRAHEPVRVRPAALGVRASLQEVPEARAGLDPRSTSRLRRRRLLRGLPTSRPRRLVSADCPRRSPRRRRDSSPRTIHVAAAATRLHGISTPRPRRRRDSPGTYPARGRGVAATRRHGIFTSRSRRRRDSSPRTIHAAAATSPRPRLRGLSARPRRRREFTRETYRRGERTRRSARRPAPPRT